MGPVYHRKVLQDAESHLAIDKKCYVAIIKISAVRIASLTEEVLRWRVA